jgi:hypothetical protein
MELHGIRRPVLSAISSAPNLPSRPVLANQSLGALCAQTQSNEIEGVSFDCMECGTRAKALGVLSVDQQKALCAGVFHAENAEKQPRRGRRGLAEMMELHGIRRPGLSVFSNAPTSSSRPILANQSLGALCAQTPLNGIEGVSFDGMECCTRAATLCVLCVDLQKALCARFF